MLLPTFMKRTLFHKRMRLYLSKRKRCLCGTYTIARSIFLFYLLMFILIYYFDEINFSKFDYPMQNVSSIVREIELHGSSGSQKINPHPDNITFIKSTSIFETCRSFSKSKLTFLIAVKSYVGNFDQRNSIRATWGNMSDDTVKKWMESIGVQIKVVFFVGIQNHAQETLQQETSSHKDIVQGSFEDNYDNNIFKTLMTYMWISKHCDETEYICFSDDDYIINIGNIVNFILTDKDLQHSNNKVMYGHLIEHSRPRRSSESKWFVPPHEYNQWLFPNYITGGSILTNRKVVNMLNAAFPYVKHLHIDDVYIGIVGTLLGITFKDDYRFSMNKQITPALMNKYFSSHFYGGRLDLIKGWDVFKAHNFIKSWPSGIT